MRRSNVFVAVALIAGVVVGVLVAGGSAGAGSKGQPVIEQNNPAFDPFQAQVFAKGGQCGTVDVPAGKRLVIEYVSADIEDSVTHSIVIRTTAAGSTVDHYIPLLGPPEGSTISIASQAVRLYANPSTQVGVCLTGLAVVGLSGYFVPVP
jgi:hypothetical protein